MRRFAEIVLSERPYLSALKDIFPVPYALEDAAFLAALRGETKTNPEFAAGVEVQRIVEAAYESARLGAAVDIKL